MATVGFINHKKQNASAFRELIKYVSREDKTIHNNVQLLSGIGCSAKRAFTDMMDTKSHFNKMDGRFFYHLYQSFHPEENVTPQQAHGIAVRLAQFYQGFQVLVATHVDNDHIHSHLVINSVGIVDGKKLRSPSSALVQLRRLSDDLCKKEGLSILPDSYIGDRSDHLSQREYRSALKGESWKFMLIRAIDDALIRSRTKGEFIQNMEYEGYRVTWTRERKNITYITPTNKHCRDESLHDSIYLKENMEALFEYRHIHGFEPFTEEPDDGWPTEKSVSVDSTTKPAYPSDIVIADGGIFGSAVRLSKAIGDISRNANAMSQRALSEHKLLKRERIKKLAAGHKLRDEQDENHQIKY